jgi:hypothetical protein
VKHFPICLLLLLLGVAPFAGCESRNPNWKETIPVSGVVLADGQPAEGVTVRFVPVGEVDRDNYTESQSMTDPEGKFAASTYELGDGIPEGEYKLTFTWGKLNPVSMVFEGDKFKGRYRDPAKSEYSVTVSPDSPVDLGTIELKTK